MRNPLKERKRFRTPTKALPSIPKNGDASALNLLSSGASPRSSKNDYLDLSGKFVVMKFFFPNFGLGFKYIVEELLFLFQTLTASNNG